MLKIAAPRSVTGAVAQLARTTGYFSGKKEKKVFPPET